MPSAPADGGTARTVPGRARAPETATARAGLDLAEAKAASLGSALREAVPTGRLGVAFSGGVDSAVLVALAAEALGRDRVLAVLATSASLAVDERALAVDLAAFIGVPLVEVVTREGERAAYIANGPDRCYHCKDELFTRIDTTMLAEHRLTAIAYGENADDAIRPDRPGARAATEHGVLRPLADAGLTKAEVRALARARGLPVADKPAAPCLASRIPHHQPVTAAKLRQIDAAETALRAAGFSDCRVRHHGEVARIEVPSQEIGRFAEPQVRGDVDAAIRAAGFRFVAVDLRGIQSGAFTLPLVVIDRRQSASE